MNIEDGVESKVVLVSGRSVREIELGKCDVRFVCNN
jgi:hypothetical protein